MLGELFDRDTSVLEDAFITIDVADLGGVADGVHIPRVIDSDGFSFLILQFANIFGIDVK